MTATRHFRTRHMRILSVFLHFRQRVRSTNQIERYNKAAGKRASSANQIGRCKTETGSMCYDQWEIRHKQVATIGADIY